MLGYIKNKICASVKQHNIFGENTLIEPTAYISGSSLYGNVHVGQGAKIYQAHIEGNINIGRFTSIWGPNIFVIGRLNGIEIGGFCSIARNVSIQEDSHNPNRITTYFLERNVLNISPRNNANVSKGKISIGNDVWIGAGAQILSGVTIADGAIIGAGAVVTKDVPPYSISVGNPAKVVKYRFNQKRIDYLMELQWWNWSIEKIHDNQEYLLSVENDDEFEIS